MSGQSRGKFARYYRAQRVTTMLRRWQRDQSGVSQFWASIAGTKLRRDRVLIVVLVPVVLASSRNDMGVDMVVANDLLYDVFCWLSFFGLGMEDGHVPTFCLLVYAMAHCIHGLNWGLGPVRQRVLSISGLVKVMQEQANQ